MNIATRAADAGFTPTSRPAAGICPHAAAGGGIMARLKSETDELHTRAERHPIMHAMISGEQPAAVFAAHLQQLLLVHHRIESVLDDLRLRLPLIAGLYDDRHRKTHLLRNDLAHFGVSADRAEPLDATAKFLEDLESLGLDNPLAWLGAWYVLEGSANGGKFIAKVLERRPEFVGGLSYLLPYGDRQPAMWAEFKTTMNEAELSVDDQQALIDAASATFGGIIDICDEHQSLIESRGEPAAA